MIAIITAIVPIAMVSIVAPITNVLIQGQFDDLGHPSGVPRVELPLCLDLLRVETAEICHVGFAGNAGLEALVVFPILAVLSYGGHLQFVARSDDGR